MTSRIVAPSLDVRDNGDALAIVYFILSQAREAGKFDLPLDVMYLGSPRAVAAWFSTSASEQEQLLDRWRRRLSESRLLIQTPRAIAVLPLPPSYSRNGIYIWRGLSPDGTHTIQSAVLTSAAMDLRMRMNARSLRDQLMGPELQRLVGTPDKVPYVIVSDIDHFTRTRLQPRGNALSTLLDVLLSHTRQCNTPRGQSIDAMVDLLRGYLDYIQWIRLPEADRVPPDGDLHSEVVTGEVCALSIAAMYSPMMATNTRSSLAAPPRVFVIHTEALRNKANLAGYAKLVSSSDPGEMHRILIPVGYRDHWTLLAYHRETNVFVHYDSMGPRGSHYGYCTLLAQGMAQYFPEEMRDTVRIIPWDIPPSQRQRGMECGYYIIAFAAYDLFGFGGNPYEQDIRGIREEIQRVMNARWEEYRRMDTDAIILRELGSPQLLAAIDKILV